MSDPLTEHGIAHQIVGDPVLFDVIFTADPVLNYRDMKKADAAKANIFNAAVREKGILKPGAKLYPHLALTEADMIQTADAFEYAAGKLVEAAASA